MFNRERSRRAYRRKQERKRIAALLLLAAVQLPPEERFAPAVWMAGQRGVNLS